jgi:hypothetical protein
VARIEHFRRIAREVSEKLRRSSVEERNRIIWNIISLGRTRSEAIVILKTVVIFARRATCCSQTIVDLDFLMRSMQEQIFSHPLTAFVYCYARTSGKIVFRMNSLMPIEAA